uniref:Uncharacterized protein n=1 Tax=Arundo donax TaxID=35708 RepID=A0A0A9ACB9_ARUDO
MGQSDHPEMLFNLDDLIQQMII